MVEILLEHDFVLYIVIKEIKIIQRFIRNFLTKTLPSVIISTFFFFFYQNANFLLADVVELIKALNPVKYILNNIDDKGLPENPTTP